jgi:predicted metal-dependent hydrolase
MFKWLRSRSRRQYLQYKELARALVIERIKHYNSFYQFKVGRISIKNQKSRWGSCSKKGNLNFNYKIIFLPKEVADYVVVHELCHLGQFNHSKEFWKLVARTLPNYELLRKKLKV